MKIYVVDGDVVDISYIIRINIGLEGGYIGVLWFGNYCSMIFFWGKGGYF